MRQTTRLGLPSALILVVLAVPLSADLITVEAFDNATVQPAGPRPGGNGKAFLNIEGSVNGNFASYGVTDFNFGAIPQVTAVNSAKLLITQSNAAFTNDGGLIISFDARATGVDIQPGTSPLAFDGFDPGTDTDESDGDLDLLTFGGNPFSFVETATGDIDEYTLGLTPELQTELVARLNSASDIRIVIGTGDSAVAATWAGATHSTLDGPTLVLDVTLVPEPSIAGWLAIVGLAILRIRKLTLC